MEPAKAKSYTKNCEERKVWNPEDSTLTGFAFLEGWFNQTIKEGWYVVDSSKKIQPQANL